MAIKTTFPILGAPVFSWVFFPGSGFKPGEDGTIAVEVLFGGFSGEARAGMSLHFGNGAPQREGFREKADPGKPERYSGIRPDKRLPETLRFCKFGRFNSGMCPLKRLPSRRRVRR